MPSKQIQALKTERERLRLEHAAGASGLAVVRDLSDAMDATVRGIWERLEGTAGAALVAVGGYGRRELSPASDVDLIVIHKKDSNPVAAAKALSYELWDGGFELGYAIYTPKEALRLAKSNFDSETAFLDARLVAGEAAVFEEWNRATLEQTRRSPGPFLTRLREATGARRMRGGDASAELEPNLKEGRGALRDLTAIGWIEKVCGPADPALGTQELAEAADLLHRIRNELHFRTGRHTDHLLMQYQREVAVALLGETDGESPENLLARSLYQGCRKVAFVLDSILNQEARHPEPAVRFVKARNESSDQRWTLTERELFFEILGAGSKGWDAFRYLEQTGALMEALPEWKAIHCLPQRNVYHRFAVDVHSFEVVCAITGLASDPDELTRRVFEDAKPGYEALLLAGLLHDIGKGTSQDHCERGEQLARTAVERMGVDEQTASDVVWLVRNHLLLSETATRRDIGEEALIVEVAEKIGSERRLRLLYLLSIADALATGPQAWGKWKSTLVSRLFTRVNHLLEQGELVGGGASALAQSTTEQLRRALSGLPPALVEAHLHNMPRAWLLSQPLDLLVRQSQMMIEGPASDEIQIHAAPQSEAGIWEVTLVARDRPRLFSRISGVLALHGLSVLGAQVFTREDGMALEVFRVAAIGNEEHRFERVAADARKALRGRLSLDLRLAEKQREYAGRVPKGKQEPPQVVVDNRASDFYTVIEVHASDRVGLLYTITRALAEMELDIHLATVSTYAEDVVDVFYVRDLDGQKVADPEHVTEIERTILHRLATENRG